MIYDELEPFGYIRSDLQAAGIIQALWNIARDTERHPSPIRLSAFLSDFQQEISRLGEPEPQQNPNLQKQVARAIAAAYASYKKKR